MGGRGKVENGFSGRKESLFGNSEGSLMHFKGNKKHQKRREKESGRQE